MLPPVAAGLGPKRPPGTDVDCVLLNRLPPAVAGVVELKVGGAEEAVGCFEPKILPPPVLAPKADVDGGGPAGVVEAFPKEKRLLVEAGPGVVAPNRDGPEVDGVVEVLSGVPKPEKSGLPPSAAVFSGFFPNENPEEPVPPAGCPNILGVLVLPSVAPNSGLAASPLVPAGAPKENPEEPVPVPLPPPNRLPVVLPPLLAVPNKEEPVEAPVDVGALKLKLDILSWRVALDVDLGNSSIGYPWGKIIEGGRRCGSAQFIC